MFAGRLMFGPQKIYGDVRLRTLPVYGTGHPALNSLIVYCTQPNTRSLRRKSRAKYLGRLFEVSRRSGRRSLASNMSTSTDGSLAEVSFIPGGDGYIHAAHFYEA